MAAYPEPMRLAVLTLIAAASMAISANGSPSKIGSLCPGGIACQISFDGNIAAGDAKAVEQAILASPQPVDIMAMKSLGGNPFEALQIARVLNKYFVMFRAGLAWGHEAGGICASACSLIYLAADQRAGMEVYLHRPTYPSAMFQAMTAPQADAAYTTAVDRLQAELSHSGVPQSLIERIMSIPSANIEKLDNDYPHYSPWMNEWLASKCGQQSDWARSQCEFQAVFGAQKQAQRRSAGAK